MRNSLFWPGLAISAAYLIAMHLIIGDRYSKFGTMGLNELGDFLAGGFSPLAFFWLVLGFLQQGRELSISSAALKSQAEELKHSVDQHKDMVELARTQLDLEQVNIRSRELQRSRSISPFFDAEFTAHQLDNTFMIVLSITNKGARVTKVRLDFTGQLAHLKNVRAVWEELFTCNFNISCQAGEPQYSESLCINYFDIDQGEGEAIFDISITPPSAKNVSNPVLIVSQRL
ncbi:hypothetical protein [Pseudomonas sp. MUP55]|uniref:hypothetical protein n=1 Tax=Pseudomonas sp. MUP55 TaxID=3087234 RepID=UPI002A59DFDC|nr:MULTISPECIES: hypothetical protein [unclassified Pseudomonas]WPN90328.1 hypothetical protein SC319_13715 [Pseudomonas sp. MUP56]WPN95853.1 hypothetical protein SC318_13720 [Pseudomonas sp. MUP55]